jgi:hypothetical protein
MEQGSDKSVEKTRRVHRWLQKASGLPAGCQELVKPPPQTLPFQCWLRRTGSGSGQTDERKCGGEHVCGSVVRTARGLSADVQGW